MLSLEGVCQTDASFGVLMIFKTARVPQWGMDRSSVAMAAVCLPIAHRSNGSTKVDSQGTTSGSTAHYRQDPKADQQAVADGVRAVEFRAFGSMNIAISRVRIARVGQVFGILWIVDSTSPWRDLPDVFGDWNRVVRRFSRWSHDGVWWRIFAPMPDDPGFGYRRFHDQPRPSTCFKR